MEKLASVQTNRRGITVDGKHAVHLDRNLVL